MGSVDEKVQARSENSETTENIVLAVVASALLLATVLKPWLLVWVVGTPLLVGVVLGAMPLRGWFRARLISVPSKE
jgi:uncharacterized membrane protein YecN with MAPEG domain